MENNINKLLDFLKKPILTEKILTSNNNKNYTFDVDKKMTKTQIKKIFENYYNTKIQSIKAKRRKSFSQSQKRIQICFIETISLIN